MHQCSLKKRVILLYIIDIHLIKLFFFRVNVFEMAISLEHKLLSRKLLLPW